MPGMSYDLNTDRSYNLFSTHLNPIDDVDLALEGFERPELRVDTVQRYALAIAFKRW